MRGVAGPANDDPCSSSCERDSTATPCSSSRSTSTVRTVPAGPMPLCPVTVARAATAVPAKMGRTWRLDWAMWTTGGKGAPPSACSTAVTTWGKARHMA